MTATGSGFEILADRTTRVCGQPRRVHFINRTSVNNVQQTVVILARRHRTSFVCEYMVGGLGAEPAESAVNMVDPERNGFRPFRNGFRPRGLAPSAAQLGVSARKWERAGAFDDLQ